MLNAHSRPHASSEEFLENAEHSRAQTTAPQHTGFSLHLPFTFSVPLPIVCSDSIGLDVNRQPTTHIEPQKHWLIAENHLNVKKVSFIIERRLSESPTTRM